MKGLLLRWAINAVGITFASYIIRGIEVQGVLSIIVAAAVLGIFNALLRPLLLVLTLPINILTLGLFTFILNGLMLWLVGSVVKGFEVHGFLSSVAGAIIISVISFVANLLINDQGRIEIIIRRDRIK